MLGIIGAMESETDGIRAELSDIKEKRAAGLTFYQGSYHDRECVVVKAGIGKVNAAMCTQALIDNYPVTAIINTGVGGALSPALHIGDIVLSTAAIEHDMDAGGLDYAPGVIPDMEIREGFDGLKFSASEALLALAQEATAKHLPDTHVMKGLILSGDVFISSREQKERLISVFGGDCCEMEGAAIAHVCFQNSIPFLIIRAISDGADDQALMDYPTFEKKAAKNSIALSLGMLENYGL